MPCQSPLLSKWPFSPLAFLHDAARCLALAHQDLLQLDAQGRLQIGSVSRLASGSILQPETPSPLSEAQAPGLSFLLGVLGHGGMLGAVGERLRLTSTGHDWLGLPAHRQIEQIRQVWWLAPASNARWLPPSRSRRSQEGYWQWLVTETVRWVAALPADRWSPADDLEQYLVMQGAGLNPAARRLPNVRRASERRAVALGMFLLHVVLPRLGLIEIQGEDQRAHLRPTVEGLTWLHAALARSGLLARPSRGTAVELSIPPTELRFPLSDEPPLVVEPNLEVIVSLGAPAVCTFEITHLAELLSPGPPARYRLTRDSLRQAIAWGYPIADLLFVLAHFTAKPLPQPVMRQITTWQEEMAVIDCEPGYKLHLAAPEILTALRRRDPFRQRTQSLASGQDAWVSEAQSPELFRYLRRVGYELQEVEDAQKQSGLGGREEDVWEKRRAKIPLRLRTSTPLPQLLVTLRTYQLLRRLVPGLADLNLQPLDQTITASLAGDDLAGVERLVESHLIFLRHHLSQDGKETGEQEEEGEAESPELGELMARLQAAIGAGGALDLTYVDAKGKTARRRVRPLHIEARWGRQYLLAFCELRQDERCFRLDRIVSIGD